MAVHLTRIYTRTGDDGTTGLADFSRVSKTDPRLVAYADCDETNATLGLVMALGAPAPEIAAVIAPGAERALRPRRRSGHADRRGPDIRRCGSPRTTSTALEADCDTLQRRLAAADSFILPGGTPAGALLHLARTVARRAERSAWALRSADPDRSNPLAPRHT